MRKLRRAIVSAAACVGFTVASLSTLAAPAAAAPPGDCPWPRVCLYNSAWVRTGAFQDVTSGWQNIPPGSPSYGAYYTYNSRNDDVAYYRFTNGQVGCVEPHRTANLRLIGIVNGIRISSEARCFT
jgi:hypothetical protein